MSVPALLLAVALARAAAAQAVPDHLECYRVKDRAARGRYTATLAGLSVEPGCVIKVPAQLVCVPAAKTNVTPRLPGGRNGATPGPFGCYKVRCPRAPLPEVRLDDQFGSRTVKPTEPSSRSSPRSRPSMWMKENLPASRMRPVHFSW